MHAGEIVGLFGLVGSGRTELLEAVFGITRADSGKIVVEGREIVPRSPRDAMHAGIALVPEDRQRLGLHFNLNLRHNLTLAAGARAGLGRSERRAGDIGRRKVWSGVSRSRRLHWTARRTR